jgi:hypothetical protein
MGKSHHSILISVQWNPRCRAVFKPHETDQAFQKDAEQRATPAAEKRAADIRAEYQQARERRLFGCSGLPRRLEELIRKRAKWSKSFRPVSDCSIAAFSKAATQKAKSRAGGLTKTNQTAANQIAIITAKKKTMPPLAHFKVRPLLRRDRECVGRTRS